MKEKGEKDMGVVEYIAEGKENAVTREQLKVLTGLSDRKIRKEIELARKRGEIILNDQDGAGYYRSENVQSLKRQYRQNNNRAMTILVQQKYIRRKLKEAGEE